MTQVKSIQKQKIDFCGKIWYYNVMKWHTEQRKINDLIPDENNPRQLTEKQYAALEKSLKKFDLAEIPAINTDNRILAGHQRIAILKALARGEQKIDVRIPDRELTDRECKEYNIRSNKNTGEWDKDKLANVFDIADLKDWGFEDKDFGINLDIPSENEDQNSSDEKDTAICPKCGHEFSI